MGEAKIGEEFITHEYDEAIAVQQCIVDAETTLSTKHPQRSAKTAIKTALTEDKTSSRSSRSSASRTARRARSRTSPRV